MRLNNMDLRARVSKHGCGLLPTHGDDACKCVSERVCAGTARCAHAGGKGEHARTHACMHVRTHAHTHTHIDSKYHSCVLDSQLPFPIVLAVQ